MLMIATCTHVHRTGRASPFRECEDNTRESQRTPQTETADPCRGCISHLKFSLCCTMKVQHSICCCDVQAQPGPLHERKESWRTSTFLWQTGRLRADRKAANIRFCTAQEIHSFHNESPALQESRSTHNAGSGSSGCISVRSCRSAAAAAFRECGASGSASAARTSGPCAI